MKTSPLLLVLAIASVLPVSAQFSRDPLLNQMLRQQFGMQSMADNFFDALQQGARYAGMKAEMAAQFETARKAFWAAYPDKPGFEQAAAEFEKQLLRRDLYYLSVFIAEGRPNRQFIALQVLTGGTFDYEIPFAAQSAFFRGWIPDVRQRLGADEAHPVLMLSAARANEFKEVMVASQGTYQAYVTKRNFEEFRRAGVTPPDFDPVHWNFISGAVGVMDQSARPLLDSLEERPEYRGISRKQDAYEQAEAFYQDSLRFFGEERLRSVATQVFAAPSPIPCPPELGVWSEPDHYIALLNQLCSGTPKLFLFAHLRNGGRSFEPWSQTQQSYDQFVKMAGSEGALLEAVEKLRTAEKEKSGPEWGYAMIKHPENFGSKSKNVIWCLRDMFGTGEMAIEARKTAEIKAGQERARFDGDYDVQGDYNGRKYTGTMSIKPNPDGTFAFTTTITTPGAPPPLTYRGTGRWDKEIYAVSLDVTYAGETRVPNKYWVDNDGQTLRGHWSSERGRETATNIPQFRAAQNLSGIYEGSYQRADGIQEKGTTTLTSNSDGSFSIVTVRGGESGGRTYKGTARWDGLALKVVYASKDVPVQTFTITGSGATLIGQPEFVILRKTSQDAVPEVRDRRAPATEVTPQPDSSVPARRRGRPGGS